MFVLNIGDLLDETTVLNWLTSQEVFQLKDEIEEVNRKMLDKILDENDFVVVYFCKCFSFQVAINSLMICKHRRRSL